METHNSVPIKTISRPLVEAILGYAAFSTLSLLSRFMPPVFLLVAISGIAFPLLWARLTWDWAAIGFTRRNLGTAFAWGVVVGTAGAVTVFLGARNDPFPEPHLTHNNIKGKDLLRRSIFFPRPAIKQFQTNLSH